MLKKAILLSFCATILFVSCRSSEHPSQVGNRDKLDRYHQQKKVR